MMESHTITENRIVKEMKHIFYQAFQSYMHHEKIQCLIECVLTNYEEYHNLQLSWMEDSISGLPIIHSQNFTTRAEAHKRYFGVHLERKHDLWKKALLELLLLEESKARELLLTGA